MTLESLKARKMLIEGSIKQNVDQVSALNGHLNECNYWIAELEKTEELVPVAELAQEESQDN